ncbi:phosphate ABC transporter permease PstA [Novosphingobium pituita]|jgi:phosphate transport system permease protein|uniref:Phosphate transport system permease protein PstA n=1 Tax=Novosphingobium pituita TaxID=3056842 RepID=A0ABQ6P5J3_9SPHN|nr:phosphate ABC transporter permease PstA [Novosphingobium sp. IK01]GMM60360.1 phosphate ABC transporter permease PstA [Novosphingobium sp. IK01]
MDIVSSSEAVRAERHARMAARLARRHRADRVFHWAGLGAVAFSALVLAFLLVSMTSNGISGFKRSELRFDVPLQGQLTVERDRLAQPDPASALELAGLPALVDAAAEKNLGPGGAALLGDGAWRNLAARIAADPTLLDNASVAVSLPASDDLATAQRGDGKDALVPTARRLAAQGKLVRAFDWGFLTRSDATSPQAVGIWGALKGSIMTMLITLVLAFPVGVLAALYLEEYAARNRWTDLIEISINNLAAVPSIIFGLLGLAVFLGLFPNYRSAPLIGGMTLALMTMPVIVISGRNAIKAVPPSIRDAALAMGASRVQVVFHHVLPLALPGILTGTIIGMARALGETAPLLMIGMRAFVASPPSGITSPSSVLPVQIFLWSDEIDRGFIERTSAAIVVLLVFLLLMNGLAIFLRNRFEKRW